MLSSTFFGSISMSFTSSGEALYSILMIIEFMQTDLPEPVVPAMRRCGIFAISKYTGSPATSSPRQTVSLLFASVNAGDSMRVLR